MFLRGRRYREARFMFFLFIFSIVICFLMFNTSLQFFTYKKKPVATSGQTIQRNYVKLKIQPFPRGGDNLKFDQPWELSSIEIFQNLEKAISSGVGGRFIIGNFSFSPGLGNLMFQYAALRIFAEELDAYLVMPSNCLLRRAFDLQNRIILLPDYVIDKILLDATSIRVFKHCCKYELLQKQDFFKNNNRIEAISGYFQSFRYFHPQHELLIRNEFQFLPGIDKIAEDIIINARRKRQLNQTQIDFTFVGVHVRHGMDITWHSRNLHHGHKAAPKEYFQKALEIIRRKYKNLIIIVISDDISWAELVIKAEAKDEVQFVNSGYREVDLALMARCNHSIISTGTFSWWSGYLNNGHVIRYGGWPSYGSDLEKMVIVSDYFLPKWEVVD